jgi:hypothetical protein
VGNPYEIVGTAFGLLSVWLRDGESIRAAMHERFIERLREAGRPFTVVRGSVEARVEAAAAVVDQMLEEWRVCDV